MWAQPFFFFGPGDDVNNTLWSAEFVTITERRNAVLRAQNEMMWSFLQRVESELDSVEGGALSHKWARIPWPISNVTAFLCGTALAYFFDLVTMFKNILKST